MQVAVAGATADAVAVVAVVENAATAKKRVATVASPAPKLGSKKLKKDGSN